eukprot:1681665-Rhodomonas_salina.1
MSRLRVSYRPRPLLREARAVLRRGVLVLRHVACLYWGAVCLYVCCGLICTGDRHAGTETWYLGSGSVLCTGRGMLVLRRGTSGGTERWHVGSGSA